MSIYSVCFTSSLNVGLWKIGVNYLSLEPSDVVTRCMSMSNPESLETDEGFTLWAIVCRYFFETLKCLLYSKTCFEGPLKLQW